MPDWELHPSPKEKKEDIEFSDNEYHAHTICGEELNPMRIAVYLRYRYEQYGYVERKDSSDVAHASIANLLEKIGRALRYVTERLFRPH